MYNSNIAPSMTPMSEHDYMVDESSIHQEVDYHSIYRSKEFLECMHYFNIEDNYTRETLLSLNEADQSAVMQALANRIYKHIVDRVNDVDFGTIPLSKGDIKKIDHYEQLVDCINIIGEIMENFNQKPEVVDTVNIALQNMIDRRDLFTKAYRANVELPIITYNSMVLAIISTVSTMVSAYIEFVKLPENKGYDIVFDKAAKVQGGQNKILYRNLLKFNKMCANGEFDKIMDYAIKTNLKMKTEGSIENVDEVGTIATIGSLLAAIGSVGGKAAAGSIAAVGYGAKALAAVPFLGHAIGIVVILLALLTLIRELIYFWFYSRTKVSDYLDAQSALLVMNAYNVDNNLTRDEGERKLIAEKQNKVAKFFKSLADKIKVKDRTAEVKADSDIKKEDDEKITFNPDDNNVNSTESLF